MILIIGLGNPGKEYEGTRHNVGREVVGAFAKKQGFGAFIEESKLKALISEGKIGKEGFALALPQTFMNKSGEAAKKAQLKFKAKLDRIFVVHDDADIEIGRTKLAFSRDSAGHKGVESVMRALGSKKFWRFRIGIGAPKPKNISMRGERKTKRTKHVAAESIVLKKFSEAEERLIKKARQKTVAAIGQLAAEAPERVMNSYNK